MTPPLLARRQKGVVVIMLFLALFLVAATVILAAVNNRSPLLQESLEVSREMEKAKEALLAYAALFNLYNSTIGPGRLPCPNSNNNAAGDPVSPCGTVQLGRLPQQITLPGGSVFEFSDHGAGIDQQFWYAVSTDYRQDPAVPLNSAIDGELTLDGEDDLVAVLIAPGNVLEGQSRALAGALNAVNYLEGGNEAVPDFFSGNADPESFNDRVLPIRRAELMSLVTVQVAQAIRVVLDEYHEDNSDTYPPDAAIFATAMAAPSAPAWYATDDWGIVTNYTFVDDDTVNLVFTDCSITFTVEFGVEGLDRNGDFDC